MSKGYLFDAPIDKRLLSLAKVALLFQSCKIYIEKRGFQLQTKGLVGNLMGDSAVKPQTREIEMFFLLRK